MRMREYALYVNLSRRKDEAEWMEETLIQAPNIREAKRLARGFAMTLAAEHRAKVEDYYAVDTETEEYSD